MTHQSSGLYTMTPVLDNPGEKRIDGGIIGRPPNPLEAWRTRLRKQAGDQRRRAAKGMARPCHKIRLGCFRQGHDALEMDLWLSVLFPMEAADWPRAPLQLSGSGRTGVWLFGFPQLKPGACLSSSLTWEGKFPHLVGGRVRL